jgi:hypothetical protein
MFDALGESFSVADDAKFIAVHVRDARQAPDFVGAALVKAMFPVARKQETSVCGVAQAVILVSRILFVRLALRSKKIDIHIKLVGECDFFWVVANADSAIEEAMPIRAKSAAMAWRELVTARNDDRRFAPIQRPQDR